ncbi:MAG: DNA-binding response regulator [Verrucomicrobiales bacterium]|nr:DNA-binding response regulator [Verrucomicrobiales bacterium]
MTLPTNSVKTARPILIVDDDVVFAQTLRGVIEAWGVQNPIHHLLDGAMLIDYLTVCFTLGSWAQPLPELIILDLNMPNVEGPEVAKWLTKAQVDLHVIGASGGEPSKSAAKFKKVGVQHFMSKPLKPEDYNTIKKVLGIATETPQPSP